MVDGFVGQDALETVDKALSPSNLCNQSCKYTCSHKPCAFFFFFQRCTVLGFVL